jgi:hypothetical protein
MGVELFQPGTRRGELIVHRRLDVVEGGEDLFQVQGSTDPDEAGAPAVIDQHLARVADPTGRPYCRIRFPTRNGEAANRVDMASKVAE